jgi:endonuclease/exonuclease/phosphatase (EEP) superfamily protein YafD
VDSVDAAGDSLVVFGIPVSIDALTRFEDQSDARVTPLTLADLNVGDYLEIRGDTAGSRCPAVCRSGPDRATCNPMIPDRPARPARRLVWITGLLGLAYVGARLPGPFALLDNLSNFPFHFAVAFLACAVSLALRGRRLVALAAAGAALLPVAQVAPWYFGRDAGDGSAAGPPVKILVSNVYHANRRHERILALIAREGPDLVGLVEVDGEWLRGIDELRRRYPFHYELPDDRYVGLGLYSRLPLEDARTLRLPGSGLPAIAATLAAPAGDVEIILVHLPAPLDAAQVRRRNDHARLLALHLRQLGKPTVVAGDLNMTMWNRGYRPLAHAGGLANARAGHGVGPTWPALWRLGVPIDHILATDGVRLGNFRVLPSVGSDHLPIAAEISVGR